MSNIKKSINSLDVTLSPSYDDHQQVVFVDDVDTGLHAIIAIHNTNLGPAVGGCRMFPYASNADALEDVLRLSRGMTYKSALAGLPMGGGKAVIIGDPATQKTPEMLTKMGKFIDSLNGQYISAEDSGTSVSDLRVMSRETDYVLGINQQQEFGGDPSPLTAHGIFCGIRAAAQYKFGRASLNGARIAIQGVGAVGRHLSKELIAAGAEVFVADINQSNVRAAQDLGAHRVAVDDIVGFDADVFAPCAMGAIINDVSIAKLSASIVAGGANNQLAVPQHGEMLRKRGVLYAPDFVINAGGIIEICRQYQNSSIIECNHQIEKIGATLTKIFELSAEQQVCTSVVAEQIAEQRFRGKSASSTADIQPVISDIMTSSAA
jgi:leucine dehydrogenase